MPLQWSNRVWQSLEECAGKRCSECDKGPRTSAADVCEPVWPNGRALQFYSLLSHSMDFSRVFTEFDSRI